MEVVILGTGDAFAAERAGSSALVVGPAGQLLIDAPDAIMRVLAQASASSGIAIGPGTFDDILITHIHGDHVNGLEAIGFWRWLERRQHGRPLPRLHTIPEVAARLWERLAPAMDQSGTATLADYFEVHILSKDGVAKIAGLEVRHRMGVHSVPVCGFLISDGKRTFGWSGDTAWVPEHLAWLSQADFFVHETSAPPTHTPLEHLNALPPAVRSKMALVHIPDGFDPGATGIHVLVDGERLTI